MLYRRTCDATGEKIISLYPENTPFPVYKHSYWFSDAWDAADYAQDYDEAKPFFEQLKALQTKVPRMALYNLNADNSEYCNMCTGNKNSYCVFGGDYNEDVIYGTLCMHNKSSVDCDYGNQNELCYDLFNSFECYGCRAIVDSKNCSNCAFISDCIGCTDCILCTNLVKKQYCIRNQQLTKEEYEKQKAAMLSGSSKNYKALTQEFQSLRSKRIVKFTHMIGSEDCTGDFIENSKGCHNVFFCSQCEDAVDGIFIADAKDTFFCSFFGHHSELGFQTMSSVDIHNSICSFACGESSDITYCECCINCKDCFGCFGLRHKQYCIFNKQYTKEEYLEFKEKIVNQLKKDKIWGRFFPKNMSCYGYNESTAMEFFPLTKEQAVQEGFAWRDNTEEPMQVEKIIDAAQLPDVITDIPDDILNWAIRCEKTGKPFRITKQELAFYRLHNLPIPHLHPDERYHDRFQNYANRPAMFARECMKCGKAIQTTYSPDRPETVYCEKCYLKEVC
jgi:hypothetical protein